MLIACAVKFGDNNGVDALESLSQLLVDGLKGLAVSAPWGIHLQQCATLNAWLKSTLKLYQHYTKSDGIVDATFAKACQHVIGYFFCKFSLYAFI